MQPYFYPYAGYYRLLAAADTLVLFDCVQFPRRGRVHRAASPDAVGRPHWLTLPIARAPRATAIKDLHFQPEAEARFKERLLASPWLQPIRQQLPEAVAAHLNAPLRNVVDHLEAGICVVADQLGLAPAIIRSSSLGIDPALRGQARVLAICERLGARTYVNPPGGRKLYEHAAFEARGVKLRFLTPYGGPHGSVLQAMAAEPRTVLRRHIQRVAQIVR